MKSRKSQIHAAFHKIPRLSFTSERRLTSYAGLVLIQALIAKLKLKAKLRACFVPLRKHAIYGPASIVMVVLLAVMLGFRRLRDIDYCREDPMLARVASKRLGTNRVFTLISMVAHNLSRELQMATAPAARATLPTRPALWPFLSLGTIRQRLLHRAGKLSRPHGELTLTVNANPAIEAELNRYLSALTSTG